MPKIAIFNTRFFYSLKSFSIDLEHWQTLFLGLIWQKKKEKISNFWQNQSRILANTFSTFVLTKNKEGKGLNFWQKSCVNPFGKMPKIRFFKSRYFYILESFSVNLDHQQTRFLGLFLRTRKKGKFSNFWQKSWAIVNLFGKMPKITF